MPVKFLVLGGSWIFWKGGGGSATLIFVGVGIFPSLGTSQGKAPQTPRIFSPFWTLKEPQENRENLLKDSKHQGIFLVWKDQGKSKHQGKEDQDNSQNRSQLLAS